MTTRFDPIQLDTAWDAIVLRESLTPAVGDTIDGKLLELLASSNRPEPRLSFVRSLERELAVTTQPAKTVVASSTTSVAHRPVSGTKPLGIWRRPPSRWMTVGYALAAIVLAVFISAFAIALQRSSIDNGPSIPAVSDLIENGPPTSPGVVATPLFAHTYSVSELSDYSLEKWSWIQLVRGNVQPGRELSVMDTSNTTSTGGRPGFSVLVVLSGTFTVTLDQDVSVQRAGGEFGMLKAPGEIELTEGDRMVFVPGAVASIWNRSNQSAGFVTGGLYERPHFSQQVNDTDTADSLGGSSFSLDQYADSPAINISMTKVTLHHGESFGYTIAPGTYLMADVARTGLQKTKWINGAPSGTTVHLQESMYALHDDSPGDYLLTNTGSEPVDVYFFKVAPADASASAAATPIAGTLFSKTIEPDELASYDSSNWRWIGFTQGTMQPGDRALIVEGSPPPTDLGYNGLGLVSVTSGELMANAAAGATIQRSATGASEPVDRSGNVTLAAGDTLIVPPNTLPAIWNAGETAATYLTAGVYTTSNITPLNEMDSEFTRSGIRIDPNDLNVGEPLTMSLQHVSIPPGASYTYTVSSETWLEAVTQGGDLEQVKRIDGATQGNSKTLVPSIYSLHMDGFGDYTLTNNGTETVEVSFFRVEAQGTPEAVASPVAQTERLVDQTLTPEQLADFRIDDWKWIEFDRNVVPPQGDGQTFASLGKIPGQNPVPGLNLLAIESGTLVVAPDADVTVVRGVDGSVESSPANAQLTLATGDALLYPAKTGGTFWNPSDTDTVVIGGGGYIRPAAPTFKLVNGNGGTSGAVAGAFGTGIKVTPGEMTSSDPVSFTIERIAISPGTGTELTIDPESWVVAVVEQGDLESTTKTNGGTPSVAVPLRQGELTLPSNVEPQTVTLRNTGTSEAVVYMMRIGR